jgi:hypothetical protein
MAVKLITMASLPIIFLIGAVSAINPGRSIVAIAICILAAIVRTRFRPMHFHSILPAIGMQADWIVVLIPTALAIQSFSAKGSLLVIGILVAMAFIRKPDGRFRIQVGPLLLLSVSSAIVFCRLANVEPLLLFLLVGTLVIRLVMTTDARKIIISMIDGCGLYLVANVLCYSVGLQSPTASDRIGGLAESTGFVRIIFPLTSTLNTPPTFAAIYVLASIFLIGERGWLRRLLRLICLSAAFVVLFSAGTRVPLAAAAVLALIVVCFPFVTRWIAQATTLLAAVSALILPSIITSTQSVIAPLISLAPGRDVRSGSIASLNNRDFIWDRSITYWVEWVNDAPRMLFGFGMNGQYRSGASLIYRERIASIVRHPELATMHNSFLQQLFDGGLLGWLLLVLAAYWASVRLSRRRREWGIAALIAIIAFTCLLLSGMTEVSMAPGPAQDTFWLLIVLIGVACQTTGNIADRTSPKSDAHNATTQQEIRCAGTLRSTRHPFQTNDEGFTLDQNEIRSTSFEKWPSMKGAASETETHAVRLQ